MVSGRWPVVSDPLGTGTGRRGDGLETGRLLFPALRADAEGGFAHERERIDAALALGVGGFILFGGRADAVRALCSELQSRSAHPLLIGTDLERGAGQQFEGATRLPPLAALGALDDLELTGWAGELTAREATALGVHWVYAPVADLDVEADNPIVGSRAFGSEPEKVAAHVAAWIRGCHVGGALACAKHFPGHGRTLADSHVELPRVEAAREILEDDLLPFRAAVEAGVDSIMTAHVGYPALDPSGTPATLSEPIVGGLLRREMGYRGIVVTDALIMEGVLEGGGDEAAAAVRAIAAGCDALLYPADPAAVARALDAAVGRELPVERVREAIERIAGTAERTAGVAAEGWGREDDLRRALDVAKRSLAPVRGEAVLRGRSIELVTVDDDVGGPHPPPPRDAFVAELRASGIEVVERDGAEEGFTRPVVVALYADIRAWKGRPGLSSLARSTLEEVVAAQPGALVVLFGHPRLAGEIPEPSAVLAAWGGEALMQRAAARRLAGS